MNQPAFPGQWIDSLPTTGEQVVREQWAGMSLREYFAAKALVGLLGYISIDDWAGNEFVNADIYADAAFAIADAMEAVSSQETIAPKESPVMPIAEEQKPGSCLESLKLVILVGEELFRFNSFEDWTRHAHKWFRNERLTKRRGYVCVDCKGRICQIGQQFMRARDERCFPIIVYAVE